MAQIEEQSNQKVINEEYKLWKKNSPFLYDLVLSSALEWPSLTVEWLPYKKCIADTNDIDYSIQRLILATHTNETEQDYLMIAEVKLPTIDPKKLSDKYKHSCDVYGGFGGAAGKIEIIQKITHNGEVNRARYMPQNSNIIGTKTKHSSINIFDRRKHTNKPIKGDKCRPIIICNGHEKEGYGLEWNKYKQGYLLSSADDRLICLWDIKQLKGNNNNNKNNKNNRNVSEISPLSVFKKHTGRVEDIDWHKRGNTCDIFVSVSSDKCIMLWDLRVNNNCKPIAFKKDAHKEEINCCEFSPFNEYLFLTGGSDNNISLWDKRNINTKLHQLEGHTESIYRVGWSPHSEVHLASSSSDRRIMIWDLSQIGHEQPSDEAEDGPPELIFVHGGHTDKISDFSWNVNDPWCIVSVADNNIVQCWQVTDELVTFEDKTQHVQLE
eukprot:511454_1